MSKLHFGRYGENFEACASPAAIEHNLRDAERRDMEVHRELRWLEQVLATRKAQIAVGTWPPARLTTVD